MWQALMDWLPDLRVGTFEVREFANVVIAGLGAYLALLAIRMGRRQEAIAKRQAEIAEVHTRSCKNSSRKLRHYAFEPIPLNSTIRPRPSSPLKVVNDGNKTARGFFWELLLSDALAQNVRFVDVGGRPVPSIAGIVGADDNLYGQYDGHGEEALFPGSSVQVGNIPVNTSTVRSSRCYGGFVSRIVPRGAPGAPRQ